MTGLERVVHVAHLERIRHELGRHDHWHVERVRTHRAAAVARLRAFAAARSPFYRELHAGLEDAPLAALPVVTRADLVEHYDRIVTDRTLRRRDLEAHVDREDAPPFRGRYTVVATSGSSGRPLPLAFDGVEWAHVLASMGRGLDWSDLRVGVLHRHRVASVATTSPWHLSCRAAMTMPQWWMPSRRFDASAPLGELAPALQAWGPDLLVTYGSLLGWLAEAQRDGALAIAPRMITVGADRLAPADRAVAEDAWGQVVFEQYAATEAAGMAAECGAHAGLHVFDDLLVLESVDGDGRPVAPGTPGERVLLTVLWARTLPLIRYEVNDAVRLVNDPCPCGRPYARIAELRGRSEESLRLVGAGGETVVINAVTLCSVMDRTGVAAWQVVEEADRLRLRLVGADAETGAAAAAAIEAALRERGARTPPIAVDHVASIERGPTGKVALVRRLPPSGDA